MQRFRRSAPLLALPLAAILAGCGARADTRWEHVGGDVVVRPAAEDAADVRLQVVSDRIIRITADPDNTRAEYAVMVRSDMKGMGLGFLLMTEIMDYARSHGIAEVFGEVLRENTTMLAMCQELGFKRRDSLEEPGVVEVHRRLV